MEPVNQDTLIIWTPLVGPKVSIIHRFHCTTIIWKRQLLLGNLYIKTHGSESRGQEEAAVRDERVSYLHVALL